MKSVLFTYFPLYVDFNHGAALLTAICRFDGVEATYAPCGPNFSTEIKGYDVVSFSLVTDADYLACLPYMAIAKEQGKEVIAGGVYARRGGKVELADKVCRGEAEGSVSAYFKSGDTTVFDHVGYCEDINALPAPDLSHVKGNEFHRNMPHLIGKKMIPYQTSRGCPNQCAFCEVHFQPRGVRIKRTINQDLGELYRQHRPDLFYLFDELPPYYLKEWRDQWEGCYFPFMSYIRADIKPEHLEWMILHGLQVTAFGIESGDERFRNEVLKKGVTDLQIYRTVNILKRNGVVFSAFYMTGAPGETAEITASTQRMIERVGGLTTVWQYQDLAASCGGN